MRGRAPRRQGPLAWLGTLPGIAGIGIVAGSALLGAIVTVVERQDPGAVLGVLLVLGTIVAALAVKTRSARLIIPTPVFCYVPAAVIAGAINDRSTDTSKIDLVIHGGTWISSGFTAMTLATILAILITGVRLFLDYRYRRNRPLTGAAGAKSRRPAPRDLYDSEPDDDLRSRPVGGGGPAPAAPAAPVGGPANGRGSSGAWRQPGGAGYPPPPGSGSAPGSYQQPPRNGGPYQAPAPGNGGYPGSGGRYPSGGGYPASGGGGYPATEGGYPPQRG
jgi:hypothetical protein